MIELARELRSVLDGRRAVLRDAKKREADAKARQRAADAALVENAEAVKLVEACMEAEASRRVYLEELATVLLQRKFGDTYSFKFDETYRDGGVLTGLKAQIYKDGAAFREGGGAGAIADFALNLAIVMLVPSVSPVVILDEALKEVEQRSLPDIVEAVLEIGRFVNFQVIVVSHAPTFRFPQHFKLTAENRGKVNARVVVDRVA